MRLVRLAAVAILASLVACGDEPTAPVEVQLIDEAALTLDVAISAGHAAALLIDDLVEHETWASTSHPSPAGGEMGIETSWTIGRTYKCYDAAGAVVNCLPFTAVRMIATDGTMGATRSSQTVDGSTVAWSGVMRHTMKDTTVRVFNGSTETTRIHNGYELGKDTTTFVDGLFHRKVAESIIDSVKAVTFQLPHAGYPMPVSGKIVRTIQAHVDITYEGRSASHDFTRRVEITFPADAQGNLALKVSGKTCMLNRVKRLVTSCL